MQPERVLRKHVAIIHAYSLMSVLQRKIFNYLLYEVSKTNHLKIHSNSVAIECRISFSELAKAVKFTSNNTNYLKEAIDGLASIKIEWNLLQDRVPSDISFLNLRVLHGPPTFYFDNTINFSFHKLLINLIGKPSIYGTIDLDLQSNFSSKYSHALYENSTRFINLNKKKVVSLDIFRKILGVDSSYKNMKEFSRKIVKSSLEEVNDIANFKIGLEHIKCGKKIIGYEFHVDSITKSSFEDHLTDNFKKLRETISKNFGGVKDSLIRQIFSSYNTEYISEKLDYTVCFAKKENSGFYPLPYFISALKYDYKDKKLLQQKEIAVPLIIDEKSKWELEQTKLVLDLNHWQKLLDLAIHQQNEIWILQRSAIVQTCKDKLVTHSEKKPIV